VNLLAARFQRRADILNRGLSGYNTRMALQTVNWVLDSPALHSETAPPLFATLFFGANDAADAKLNPKQHVPLAEYTANLAKLLATMRAGLGAQVPIVVISPGALNELQYLDSIRSREPDASKASAIGADMVSDGWVMWLVKTIS
jgi:lysophospholipase L1-like esterase